MRLNSPNRRCQLLLHKQEEHVKSEEITNERETKPEDTRY